MTLNGQKLFVLEASRISGLQYQMVNRRPSGRLMGYFRTFIGETRFLTRKIFTFLHITVFASPSYIFYLFFLETSCYKTFAEKEFGVLLYILEFTRIFPKTVAKPKNRQIFTFCHV